MFRKGIDISNYTVPLTQAKILALQEADIKFVIIGAQHLDAARQHLWMLDGKGFDLELYAFPAPDQAQIKNAIALARDYPTNRIWLDMELRDQVAANLDEALALVEGAGYEAGIYTGAWWWIPNMKASGEKYKDYPLWYANYKSQVPDEPSFYFDHFQGFAGWKRPQIWQYSSAGMLGINCDLNIQEVQEVTQPVLQDGWHEVGNVMMLVNNGVSVIEIGSNDGLYPGQIRKLFGDVYWYLRLGAYGSDGIAQAYWSREAGD